jgi:hypothetical protein
MSQKYTAEEVRAQAEKELRNGLYAATWDMLKAYADLLERIKADDGAVPIGYTRVDCIEALKEQDFAPMIRLRQRGDYTVPLYLRPPAQAAQVDEYAAGWRQAARWAERNDLLADIGSPAYERDKAFVLQKPTAKPGAQPTTNPPETGSKSVDGVAAQPSALNAELGGEPTKERR